MGSTEAEAGAREAGLTESDIILLFAADFAEPQVEGYEVPCSSAQVKLSSLVREMITTAFVSLASRRTLELGIGKKKHLFSEHRTVFASLSGGGPPEGAGLEGAILRQLRPREAENSARDVVSRVVGSTTIEPYSAIVEMSMDNAASAGYFEEQARTGTAAFLGKRTLPKLFLPRCERIAALAPRVDQVNRMREDFKKDNPELYEVLYEDIEKSVRAAYFRT